MITLINGGVQNASNIFVPNGSIVLQLNVDATVVAAPGGFVSSNIPIVFQFDKSGNILPNSPAVVAQIWSNAELNPQLSSTLLGTYYLVTLYDQAGSRLNQVPMWWQFPEAANATVNISKMVPYATIGGNVIFYPTLAALLIPPPAPATLGGVFSNAGITGEFISAINTDGTVSLTGASGLNTQVQFNDGGIFAGNAGLTFIKASSTLVIAGPITFNGTTGSATIGVAAAAGTPHRINLPTLSGLAGNVPVTDGGTPQQLSWSNITPVVFGSLIGITGATILTVDGSGLTAGSFYPIAVITSTANGSIMHLTCPSGIADISLSHTSTTDFRINVSSGDGIFDITDGGFQFITTQGGGVTTIKESSAPAGAQFVLSMDTGVLSLGGSVINGNFGESCTYGWAEELLTLSLASAYTDTAGSLLPANSIIDSVVVLITQTISGGSTPTTWEAGDPTTAARFISTGNALTATTSAVGLNQMKGSVTTDAAGPTQATAAKVRITLDQIPGQGIVRITVFYRTFVAPTH